MITTSPAYKREMDKTHRDRAYMRIRLGIIDLDAYRDAALASGNPASFNWFSQMTAIPYEDGVPTNTYATCEKDRMRLGDNQLIASKDFPIYQGYASYDISTAASVLTAQPYIHISFTKAHTFPALTFVFDDTTKEYPSEMQVIAYRNGAQASSETIYPDGSTYVHYRVKGTNAQGEDGYKNVTGIRLVFMKTRKPQQRARLQQLTFGAGIIYGNEILTGAHILTDIDPIMRRMEEANFDFSIINDGMYDPDRPSGIGEWIESMQPIKVEHGQRLRTGLTWADTYASNWENIELNDWKALYEGGVTEWIMGGRYVLTGEPEVQGRQATFKARSRLSALTNSYHMGQYEKNGKTLYALAEGLLETLINDYADQGQLPYIEYGKKPYYLHPDLGKIWTTAPLPKLEFRELLQLIANAAGMIAYTDREGRVCISYIDNTQHQLELDFDETYPEPPITKTPPLYGVNVNHYTYKPAKEVSELHKGEYMAGTHMAEFDFAEDVEVRLKHRFTVRATGQYTDTQEMSITVVAKQKPEFITEGLPDGMTAQTYWGQAEARGSSGITYSVKSGTLPKGLKLNAATGEITGEPAINCFKYFTIRARHSEYGYADRLFSIKIDAIPAPTIETEKNDLPRGRVGQEGYGAYIDVDSLVDVTFTASTESKGVGDLKITKVDSDTARLTFDHIGYDDKPAKEEEVTVKVRASSKRGYDEESFPIPMGVAIPLEITNSDFPDGRVGEKYLTSDGKPIYATATGGVPPYKFSVTNSLPPGLAIKSGSGRIYGVPRSTRNEGFRIHVKDAAGTEVSEGYTGVVIDRAENVSINDSELPDAALGAEYEHQISYDGSGNNETGKVTFTIISGSLPAGLKMNSRGKITGTPATTYVSNVTATSGTASFTTAKAGEVTVLGRKIETSSESTVVLTGQEGELYELENPLITDQTTALARAEQARDHLKYRTTYDFNYRGRPEVEATDKLYTQSKYTRQFPARVLKHELNFDTGAYNGKATMKRMIEG